MKMIAKPETLSIAGDKIELVKFEIVFDMKRYRWENVDTYISVIYFIKTGHIKPVFWLVCDVFKDNIRYPAEICQKEHPLQNDSFVLDKVLYVRLFDGKEWDIYRKPFIYLKSYQNLQKNFYNST